MSATGEFQRYLATALAVLPQRGDAGGLDPGLTRLRAELESAQVEPEASLAECAERAIRALEFFWSDEAICANSAALLPDLRASAEDLRSISQIIVGQTGPAADRNSPTQES
ncbi:MAG TPA: hypothetical protein EYQ54_03815 [Myxococcales bacterium]|nr:hypothetical protein [Myxococcales bacterium]HIL01776.1 hypothetical protein [Myxococcales bacterium]